MLDITLAEARALWHKMREADGGDCPCCDRFGKNYLRGINHTMAAGVIWLAQRTEPDGDFIRVPKTAPRFMLGSNQHTTMKWWKLVERQASDDPAKKHSGYWRITALGKDWAMGLVKVDKYVLTYDNTVLATVGPKVGPEDCLDNFDYRDAMGPTYIPTPPPKPKAPRKPRKPKS